MKIIVGLGNPGKKYENNRHNVGFQFIDYLIENLATRNSQTLGLSSSRRLATQIKNEKLQVKSYELQGLILAKPQTFMNLSGLAVKTLTANYQLLTTNLYVVHDDLDIPLGKFRIDFAKGPKLHNGIASIEQHLKTKGFWRVRIGVDNRMATGPMDGESYVLKNFRPEEKEIIKKIFPKIFERLLKKS